MDIVLPDYSSQMSVELSLMAFLEELSHDLELKSRQYIQIKSSNEIF